MQIVNHYKNQVKKSFLNLKQQQVLTQDQFNFNPSQSQQSINQSNISSLITQIIPNQQQFINTHNNNHNNNHNNQQSQQQQISKLSSNPYLVQKRQGVVFNKGSKCVVCYKNGKYRCPQCLISYCSSIHYKSHNLFCSQQFYKKQVQNQMKSLKSTQQQKSQIKQILKQHNQLISQQQPYKSQSQSQTNQINQQRLLKILSLIQQYQNNNQQINQSLIQLSQKQITIFNSYLKQIQSQSNNYTKSINQSNFTPLSTDYQPYWLIPDGLDYYFMQQLQIQEFASSQHLNLIICRQILSKKYTNEIKNLSLLIKSKVSPLIRQDILQYLILWVLITLAHAGQIKNKDQILNIIQHIYITDLGKNITEKNISQQEAGSYTLALIKQKISTLKSQDTKNLLNSWYQANVISSCKLIVKNKFLLIQTFLRLLQFFQSIEREVSSAEKVSKKKLNIVVKHVKKIQFILSYIRQQTKPKQIHQLQIKRKSEQDLFRHIYRILSKEENQLLTKKQQIQTFKDTKSKIQFIQQHGILIKQ